MTMNRKEPFLDVKFELIDTLGLLQFHVGGHAVEAGQVLPGLQPQPQPGEADIGAIILEAVQRSCNVWPDTRSSPRSLSELILNTPVLIMIRVTVLMCCSPGGQWSEVDVQGDGGCHGCVRHGLVGHLALEADLQQVPGGQDCHRGRDLSPSHIVLSGDHSCVSDQSGVTQVPVDVRGWPPSLRHTLETDLTILYDGAEAGVSDLSCPLVEAHS